MDRKRSCSCMILAAIILLDTQNMISKRSPVKYEVHLSPPLKQTANIATVPSAKCKMSGAVKGRPKAYSDPSHIQTLTDICAVRCKLVGIAPFTDTHAKLLNNKLPTIGPLLEVCGALQAVSKHALFQFEPPTIGIFCDTLWNRIMFSIFIYTLSLDLSVCFPFG